jgi:hypothetical protein
MPTVSTDQTDRTLTIQATPVLQFDGNGTLTGVDFTYAQTGSTPNMPNMVNQQNGNINLRNMPSNHNYTDNVDITINLTTTASGYGVQFASSSQGNGPIWFCVSATDPTPIPTPANMSCGANTSSQVYIDDNQSDGGLSYSFCMGVMVPALSSTPFTIDPIVTGKGQNSSSFMLSE